MKGSLEGRGSGGDDDMTGVRGLEGASIELLGVPGAPSGGRPQSWL